MVHCSYGWPWALVLSRSQTLGGLGSGLGLGFKYVGFNRLGGFESGYGRLGH